MTAVEICRLLQLEPLQPEGGFFRQTFKDANMVGSRAASTCIYYLLTAESFSAFHRVTGTEIFHFLRGDPAEMVTIDGAGALARRVAGVFVERGEAPQLLVPPLVWQALRVIPGGSFGWTLFSTTVSPGFEYEDFTLGSRAEMSAEFPAHARWIGELTRG